MGNPMDLAFSGTGTSRMFAILGNYRVANAMVMDCAIRLTVLSTVVIGKMERSMGLAGKLKLTK